MIKASWPTLTPNLMVLDSREAILALAPLLERVAERVGQPGAMHWLPYFLDRAVSGLRVPCLVLRLRPEQQRDARLEAADIEAAALFFEYAVLGVRTGAVVTGDAVGFNTVIAPEGERTQMAAIAARALIDRGAAIVLSTYGGANEAPAEPVMAGCPGVLFATRRRRVGRMLRLYSTMDATLAQMGKSTRFNLRYYRRRLEKHVGCEYVADASEALRGADLDALNAGSLNPISAAEFRRRVDAASNLPGSFLSGLRDADGRWLSLTGGWRQGDATVLFWQMNSAGWEKCSLGTAMRSFFLEHEIAHGARRLLIYGGTPHPMRHAFVADVVCDLVVRRDGLRAAMMTAAARLFVLSWPAKRQTNFLASTLCDGSLEWVAGQRPVRERGTTAAKPASPQRAA